MTALLKIQRLNMDNSWLLHIGGVKILIDPWLEGDEVDFFPWFNRQWHRTKPLPLKSLEEFDFVLITQKYPDHFHLKTLNLIKPKRLVGPRSIHKRLSRNFPDAEVLSFNKNIKSVFGFGINIHCIPSGRNIDPIYDALIIEDGSDSIFLASHGYTKINKWRKYLEALPPCKLILTPFNEYKLPVILGGTVSPGLEAVKELVEVLSPKYVVATHDEDKHAKGLVSKMAQIKFSPSAHKLREEEIFKDRIRVLNDYKMHEL